MSDLPDLFAATRRTSELVAQVGEDDLDRPSPCPDYPVRGLLTHLDGLCQAFTAAARKDLGPVTAATPGVGDTPLDSEWRSVLPRRLEALAQAWRDPSAWDGMTQAGGVDLPGAAAGLFASNEVLIHGWDLAVAIGARYEPEAPAVQASLELLEETRNEPGPPGLFGPVIDVPEGAPVFHRVLGLSGRDAGWRPA